MSRRILNIYLYRESDQLILRIIDINPSDVRVTKSKGYTITYHVNHVMDDIGEVLEDYWAKLNHFEFIDRERLGVEPRYQYKSYYFDNEFIPFGPGDRDKWFADNNRHEFTYHDIRLELPQTSEASLLKLLIGLDPFMNDFILNLDPINELYVNYYAAPPDIPNVQNYIRAAFSGRSFNNDNNINIHKEKLFLSRFVVNWLSSELTDQAMTATLKELLASDQTTLTQVIREKLYPESAINYFIEANCTFYKDDIAMAALFNPKIPCKQAVDILRKQLRSQSTSDNKHTEKLTNTNWFKRYSWMRQLLWEDIIYTVIGKSANDGIYSKIYTEIQLLREANFSLNSKGDMVLHYGNTPTYKQYYDKKDQNYYNDLEKELRTLCDLMGLHFLPAQDFHAGEVSFDSQSTTYLMNCGFHITEDYCKSLVHRQHFYRLFNPETAVDSPLDIQHPDQSALKTLIH